MTVYSLETLIGSEAQYSVRMRQSAEGDPEYTKARDRNSI